MLYTNNFKKLPKSIAKKLWERVEFPNGWSLEHDQSAACFTWRGRIIDDRPLFRFEGKYIPARIIIFETCHGPIDDGKYIFTTCGKKDCVNPYHLPQSYYFRREVNARGGAKDPADRRKKLKVDIRERDILRAFNGISCNRAKTIADVGRFLNIEDELVVDFLNHSYWQYINEYYTNDQLDMLRANIGII